MFADDREQHEVLFPGVFDGVGGALFAAVADAGGERLRDAVRHGAAAAGEHEVYVRARLMPVLSDGGAGGQAAPERPAAVQRAKARRDLAAAAVEVGNEEFPLRIPIDAHGGSPFFARIPRRAAPGDAQEGRLNFLLYFS